MTHKPSMTLRVMSSLFLSSLYFVFAIGIWSVARNQLGVSADTVATNDGELHLLATYSDQQRSCIKKGVGDSRYWALGHDNNVTLDSSETKLIGDCLKSNPIASPAK